MSWLGVDINTKKIVYRLYRIDKYKKIIEFLVYCNFCMVRYCTVSFRYGNSMNFLIPQYTEILQVYTGISNITDVHKHYWYILLKNLTNMMNITRIPIC